MGKRDEQNGMGRSDDTMASGSMERAEGGVDTPMPGGAQESAALGGMRAMSSATNGAGGHSMGGARARSPRPAVPAAR